MQNYSVSAVVVIVFCSAFYSHLSTAADTDVGNPEAGKIKAALCQGCHGMNGEGMTLPPGQASSPRLAGQVAAYFIKSLNDYKNEVRVDPMMNAIAKSLTEPDIANLAAYYSALD